MYSAVLGHTLGLPAEAYGLDRDGERLLRAAAAARETWLGLTLLACS